MPKPKLTIPSRKLTVHIPEDVAARVELILISPTQGKVPYGKWAEFVTERLREFLNALGEAKSADNVQGPG